MHETTSDAWGLFKRAEGFSNLARPAVKHDALVASSARMRSLKKRLVAWAKTRDHVVIAGGPGTERRVAARLVHSSAGFEADTQVEFDCREVDASRIHSSLFGLSMSHEIREGSGCFGALHLAHGGSLLVANLESLAPEEQRHLAAYLRERRESHRQLFPDVLVIGTVRALEEDGTPAGLVPELVAEFPNAVQLPSLAERPKEILPLAHRIVEDLGRGAPAPTLTRSAEHALVSLRYRRGNVEELRHVIELAANCCEGDEISAEHIFAALGEEEAFGANLGQPRALKRLLQGRGIVAIRTMVLGSFLATIAVSLIAPESRPAAVSNGFLWIVWEPLVFGLFLLAGAVWCTICPLSFAARLGKHLVRWKRPPPAWLTRWGDLWIPAAAFVAILLTERVFHMTANPAASSLMLSTLILGSVLFGAIFEREVWCRHVCPLGRMAVVLAPGAPLSVAADRTRCASTCTTHECYKGNAGHEGCPVYHHPLMTSEAHHCKLCGDCLNLCPHQSTSLFVRPPLAGTWRLGGSGSFPVGFALVMALVVPLLLATRRGGVLADPAVLSVSALAALVLGLVTGGVKPEMFGLRTAVDRDVRIRIAAVIAVLAWGPLMADQFANIPLLGRIRLTGDGLWSISLLTLSQLTVILFAAFLATVALWHVLIRSRRQGHEIAPLTRLAIPLVLPLYIATALALVL